MQLWFMKKKLKFVKFIISLYNHPSSGHLSNRALISWATKGIHLKQAGPANPYPKAMHINPMYPFIRIKNKIQTAKNI